jgi:CheY-like chemotaxis protein
MKFRVLWIEDNALTDLAPLLGPIYVSGQYDLEIAEDASEGARKIKQMEFDAVIVDVRLPPGDDPRWIDAYNRAGRDRARAQLGFSLLYSLLRPEKAEVELEHPPSWVKPERFGIFTVETKAEVQKHLDALGVPVHEQKKPGTSSRVLLDLVGRITAKAPNQK